MSLNSHSQSSAVHGRISELFRWLIPQEINCVVLLIIFVFLVWYLHWKVQQEGTAEKFPKVPAITIFRAMYTGRKTVRVKALEMVFGLCCLFPKEGMYGMVLGPRKTLVLFSPEAIEFVLKSRNILRKSTDYEFLKSAVQGGILLSTGDKWRTRRKQLTPALHFRVVDNYCDVFNKHAKNLVQNIHERMGKETSIDMIDVSGVCTMDIILETMMEKSIDAVSTQKNQFLEVLNQAQQIIFDRYSRVWLWNDFIFSRTKEGRTLAKYTDFINKFVRQMIEERKRHMTEKFDATNDNRAVLSDSDENGGTGQHLGILDLLVNLHLKDNSVSYEEIMDEITTFIVAAHDTTSLAVSWTLHFLGWHQNIQREIQQEIDMVLGNDIDRIITTEDAGSLKYLHRALKESLRLYPPGAVTGRILEEDTIINGYKVSRGTDLVIVSHVLHRNPEFFPNPEVFRPDRFLEENSKNRHPFAYIPFSAGPRNCIGFQTVLDGQRYATYSSLTILATVLRHFDVTSIEHRDKIMLKLQIATTPVNGLLLKFTKRDILKNYSSDVSCNTFNSS